MQGNDDEISTVRDAIANGATYEMLRSPRLTSPTRGTRAQARERMPDEERALFIASLVKIARPNQFFSHTTAARVHGMPLPRRLENDAIHLASPTATNRMRRCGVVGHRIKANVVEVEGLRVESRADTFIHLASILTLDELVAVGDWLVSKRRAAPLTADDLLAHSKRFKGMIGMQLVLAAIALIRVGADSPAETRTRLLIVRAGLPEPVLQYEIRDAFGNRIATVDLAYPERRLAIEYEGDHHRTSDDQFHYDLRRYSRVEDEHWNVIRVTKRDLQNGGVSIIALIRNHYMARSHLIGQ